MSAKPSPSVAADVASDLKWGTPALPDDDRRAQAEVLALQKRIATLEAEQRATPSPAQRVTELCQRVGLAKDGRQPLLYIFDADGTLRRCTVPGQVCPNRIGEWELIPGVRERLARIDWRSTAFGVASNQGGIALGYLDEATAYQLLCDMVVAATGGWPPVGSLQLCPHAPDAGCACRKPHPEMLLRICDCYCISPREAIYVGDQENDREAAERADIAFSWAKDFFGWGSAP